MIKSVILNYGNHFTGNYKNGQRNGKGIKTWADGTKKC